MGSSDTFTKQNAFIDCFKVAFLNIMIYFGNE